MSVPLVAKPPNTQLEISHSLPCHLQTFLFTLQTDMLCQIYSLLCWKFSRDSMKCTLNKMHTSQDGPGYLPDLFLPFPLTAWAQCAPSSFREPYSSLCQEVLPDLHGAGSFLLFRTSLERSLSWPPCTKQTQSLPVISPFLVFLMKISLLEMIFLVCLFIVHCVSLFRMQVQWQQGLWVSYGCVFSKHIIMPGKE